jgi:hypothetical protein
MRVWTSSVVFMLERIPTWSSVVNCSNIIAQGGFRTLHQEFDLADSGRGNSLSERARVVWKDARGVDRPMPLLRQPSRGGDAVRRDSRYQACAALDEFLPLLRSRVPETSRQAGLGTEGKVDLRESWDATSRITGGVVYDAPILRAAERTPGDRVLTFKVDDFRRLWPDGAAKIATP